jgi:hypothetical protein
MQAGLPWPGWFELNRISKGKTDAYIEDRAGGDTDRGRSTSPRSHVLVEYRRDSTRGEVC